MKNFRTYLSLLTLVFSFSFVFAQSGYRVEEVPNVQLQDYRHFVSDPEGVLSASDLAQLNQELLELRDSLTVQVAVVILPAIDVWEYGDSRTFANELFNDWGIGAKDKDNGLLILLQTAEGHREVTFETGYGMEGVLTDGVSRLIQTKLMIPFFKNEEWGAGLMAGLSEIRNVIEGDSEILRAEQERVDRENREFMNTLKFFTIWNLLGIGVVYFVDTRQRKRLGQLSLSYNQYLQKKDSVPTSMGILALVFLIGFIIYAILKSMVSKNSISTDLQPSILCEHCGQKGSVKYRGVQIARQARIGRDGLNAHKFYCQNCGYSNEIMTPFKYIAPIHRTSGSGPWGKGVGGGFGGGFGGGGSWGGGMSGGGGASTKF